MKLTKLFISTLLLTFVPAVVFASSAMFSWLPNSPDEVVLGYKIHYGTASRVYDNVVDVGKPEPIDGRISGEATELKQGVQYFFAATAYNGVGESDYSNEVSHSVPVGIPSAPTDLLIGNVVLNITTSGGIQVNVAEK